MRAGVTYGEIMADLLGLGTAFGSTLDFIGGLAANYVNKSIADQNIDFQREANAQNLALVRETNAQNIAFQQRENEITRSREDNAVQRAAADMTAAGLSKTLAAGNPASAAALNAPKAQVGSVKALNNQFKYESALQKLNLGSLMLDMASKKKDLEIKDKVAEAQVENLAANTAGINLANENYLKDLEFSWDVKAAQAENYRANSARVGAETELYNIEKEYKADQIMADIGYKVSQTNLTNANIEKVAQEISESIARENKLGKEAEELTYKITYADLQNKALEHNIGVAEKYDYPTGVWPTNLLGYTDRLTHGTTDFLFGNDSFYFGLPQIVHSLTDESNKNITNPAKARKFFNFFNFGL